MIMWIGAETSPRCPRSSSTEANSKVTGNGSHCTLVKPASRSTCSSLLGSASAKGLGPLAQLTAEYGERQGDDRHLRWFPPYGDGEPSSRNKTGPHMCERAHGIVEEHESPAADHRIEGVKRQRLSL